MEPTFTLLFLVFATLQPPAADANNLSWMAGCWSMSTRAGSIEEHWSKPSAGQLMGWSRTLRNNKVSFSEFMRIEQSDGRIVYHARIGGTVASTPFTLQKMTDSEAEFTNPAHDFPQLLRYIRVSDTEMRAQIEALDRANPKTQTYNFRRVSCDPQR